VREFGEQRLKPAPKMPPSSWMTCRMHCVAASRSSRLRGNVSPISTRCETDCVTSVVIVRSTVCRLISCGACVASVSMARGDRQLGDGLARFGPLVTTLRSVVIRPPPLFPERRTLHHFVLRPRVGG
jgi:hypothetical protein